MNSAMSEMNSMIEVAWGLIANASNGDWTKQHPEWVSAAEQWRERFHALLDSQRNVDGQQPQSQAPIQKTDKRKALLPCRLSDLKSNDRRGRWFNVDQMHSLGYWSFFCPPEQMILDHETKLWYVEVEITEDQSGSTAHGIRILVPDFNTTSAHHVLKSRLIYEGTTEWYRLNAIRKQHNADIQTINGMADSAYATAVEKGWEDKPATVLEHIAMIHSEAGEATNAYRDHNPRSDKIPQFSQVEEELADVVIRVFQLCSREKWNIGGAIHAKAEYNKTREKKHGGKVC